RWRAALDILHLGGVGRDLGIERAGSDAGELLHRANSLGCRGGRILSRHGALSDLLVPARLSCAPDRDLHGGHSICQHHWWATFRHHPAIGWRRGFAWLAMALPGRSRAGLAPGIRRFAIFA